MKLFILFSIAFFAASSFAQNDTCPEGQVLCEGTVDECVPEEFICDGKFIDCSNDADETSCACDMGYFPCPNSDICIPNSWICNGPRDCPGGEDEDEYQDCLPCQGFECNNGECIPSDWVCDGDWDCDNGEDEGGDCIPPPCDGLKCEESGQCLPGSWICDGEVDCFDGSDEANCTMAAVPAVPFKGNSMMASTREVKAHKLTTLIALSKSKTKRTKKEIQGELGESSYSRRNHQKLRQ